MKLIVVFWWVENPLDAVLWTGVPPQPLPPPSGGSLSLLKYVPRSNSQGEGEGLSSLYTKFFSLSYLLFIDRIIQVLARRKG